MAVIDLIKQDRRVKKLLKLIKNGRFNYNCAAKIKEIRRLHIERSGRNLKVSDVIHHFQSKILQSILQAQANRTTIVAIKLRAFEIHAKLDKHTSLVKKHLRHTYIKQLNMMMMGTSADRDSLFDSVLALAFAHLKDLKTVTEIADIAINDLDQFGWSYKSIIKVMEQVSENKIAKV